MKILIKAAKQVGQITHCTKNAYSLYNILQSGRVWLSDESSSPYTELNPKTGKQDYFSCFSRDPIAAIRRNPKRWTCGVIIDGNKLSEHYHIEPYSYSGVQQKVLAIKYFVKYDDGTYFAYFVNWGSKQISSHMYEYLATKIQSIPESLATKKHLEHSGIGKRKNADGRKAIEKYVFNVKTGDSGWLLTNAPDYAAAELRSLQDEKEERIWKNNYEKLYIGDCILGIIIPKDRQEEFEPVIDLLESKYDSDNIVYY